MLKTTKIKESKKIQGEERREGGKEGRREERHKDCNFLPILGQYHFISFLNLLYLLRSQTLICFSFF